MSDQRSQTRRRPPTTSRDRARLPGCRPRSCVQREARRGWWAVPPRPAPRDRAVRRTPSQRDPCATTRTGFAQLWLSADGTRRAAGRRLVVRDELKHLLSGRRDRGTTFAPTNLGVARARSCASPNCGRCDSDASSVSRRASYLRCSRVRMSWHVPSYVVTVVIHRGAARGYRCL